MNTNIYIRTFILKIFLIHTERTRFTDNHPDIIRKYRTIHKNRINTGYIHHNVR